MYSSFSLVFSRLLFTAGLLVSGWTAARAQVVGPNIDLGQEPLAHNPTGAPLSEDKFNRWLETDIAANPRNPAQAVAVFMDYRYSLTTGESWCSWALTKDGGDSWKSSPLPDLPGTPIAPGNFCGDPVVVWDVSGNAHMIVLTGNRSDDSRRVIAVKLKPKNDLSGDLAVDRMVQLDLGNQAQGQGIDKPSIAYSPPGSPEIIHAAWALFDGSADRAKVMYAQSRDGGVTYSKPIKLNATQRRGNNTAMAVTPDGTIYIAFTDFDSDQRGIYLVKSTDLGTTFSNPIQVTAGLTFYPYHQFAQSLTTACPNPATCPLADRSLVIPTLAVDGKGQILMAWQEYVNLSTGVPSTPVDPAGQVISGVGPRLVCTGSADGGATWLTRKACELGSPNAQDGQIKPRMAFSGGIASMVFEDARGGGCSYTPIPALNNLPLMTGINCKRNIRVMQAELCASDSITCWNAASSLPTWAASVQVSKYLKRNGQTIVRGPNCAGSCPAVYEPNDPSSASGSTPFTGDYIGIGPVSPLVTGSAWRFPTRSTDPRSFYVLWADNRWGKFPLNSSGKMDNTQPWNNPPYNGVDCNTFGTRNIKPVFAKVSPGLVAYWSGTDKQIIQGSTALQPRLVLTVQNLKNAKKFAQVTILEPTGEDWSFSLTRDVNVFQTEIGRFSSVNRVLSRLPSSTNPTSSASVQVLVEEINKIGADAVVIPAGSRIVVSFSVTPDTVSVSGALHDLSLVCDPTNPKACQKIKTSFKRNTQASDPFESDPFESDPFESDPFESDPFESDPFESSAIPDHQVTWQVQGSGVLPTSTNSLTHLDSGQSLLSNVDSPWWFQLLVFKTYQIANPIGCTQVTTPNIDTLISSIPIAKPNSGNSVNRQISNTDLDKTGFKTSDPFESDPFESDPFESTPFADRQLSNATFFVNNGGNVKVALRAFKKTVDTTGFDPTQTNGAAGEGAAAQATNPDGSQKLSFDDNSPPIITNAVAPASNAAGWHCNSNSLICPTSNHAPVNVTWTVVDAGSGVAFKSGCDATTLSAETSATGTTLTCSATNGAGVPAPPLSVTVKIDLTPPSITIVKPIDNGKYLLGAPEPSQYSCTDTLSGLSTCAGPVPSGSNFDTSTFGPKAFTVNASDVAGNTASQTRNYNVFASFIGFLSPLATAGTESPSSPTFSGDFTLGKAIPIKWQLKNAAGAFISDLSTLSLLEAAFNPDCAGVAEGTRLTLYNPTNGATGNSTYRYSTKDNQFIFNWDTSSTVGLGTGCWNIRAWLYNATPRATIVRVTK